MTTAAGRKATGSYNRLAQVLMAYEIMYYQGWLSKIDAALDGLNAFILVRDNVNAPGDIYVNFDISLLELMREIHCMKHMSLDIPLQAMTFIANGSKFKGDYNALVVRIILLLLSTLVISVRICNIHNMTRIMFSIVRC